MARRLGLLFGELPIRGETRVAEVEQFYDLDFGPHEPELTLAEWAGSRLGGSPALDAVIAIPGGKLVVRRLESGRIAAWACSSTSCFRSSPTSGFSRGSRPKATSSAPPPLARAPAPPPRRLTVKISVPSVSLVHGLCMRCA